MKPLWCFFAVTLFCTETMAADLTMDAALRATYTNCVGIDDALHDMKVKAGINTAVTGVGTGLGIGATAAGIAKAKTDDLFQQKIKNLAWSAPDIPVVDSETWLVNFKSSYGDTDSSKDADKALELLNKSKKLGHWRTGLLAGNTATNIAGVAIAGTNKVKEPLEKQIENCKASIKDLRNAISQAKFNGEDTSEATEIESACKGFEYVDITKINNRATGSMASSIVGAGTGTVGVIVSALANSDKVRNDNNSQKEKNLNTAANVLSAGSTVASATATIFNATQIKAIKEVAEIAEKCTGVLK